MRVRIRASITVRTRVRFNVRVRSRVRYNKIRVRVIGTFNTASLCMQASSELCTRPSPGHSEVGLGLGLGLG